MAKEIQFLLYNLPNNSGKVQAYVEDETLWLTQKAMAELFGVEVNTINYHLKEIFLTGELIESSTIRKIRTVQPEGIVRSSAKEHFILLMPFYQRRLSRK